MIKILKPALAAAAIAMLAAPVAAQDEESRSTWQVTAIDVADGGMDRWQEIMMEHIVPAHEAAGLSPPQLHWVMMNDNWDMVVISEVPGGMASFDSHMPAARVALRDALIAQEGSMEAVLALFQELRELEDDSSTLMTHSHP